MAKFVTPEMLLERNLSDIVRRELRVHGVDPSSPAHEIGVGVGIAVLVALNAYQLELRHIPTPPTGTGEGLRPTPRELDRAAGYLETVAKRLRARDDGLLPCRSFEFDLNRDPGEPDIDAGGWASFPATPSAETLTIKIEWKG